MKDAQDVYTHGHHASVLRSHSWRTVENSSSYMLNLLEPGQDLLDVGCGPGTITIGLANRVFPGKVIGIDTSDEVLSCARQEAASYELDNIEFKNQNVYSLEYDDESFDVIHVHQVLQHLAQPVRALEQMRRLLRPNGFLAVRESDFGAFTWSPPDPLLDRWLELYYQVTNKNGADANAGRSLLAWVHAAGFSTTNVSGSTWTFADNDSRSWWGGLWAERMIRSDLASQACDYGFSSPSELQSISNAFKKWSNSPDGYFSVFSTEVIAWH